LNLELFCKAVCKSTFYEPIILSDPAGGCLLRAR
jgi:hypothetical protein